MKYKIAIILVLLIASIWGGIYMTGGEVAEETHLAADSTEEMAPKKIEVAKVVEEKTKRQSVKITKSRAVSSAKEVPPTKQNSRPVIREEVTEEFVQNYPDFSEEEETKSELELKLEETSVKVKQKNKALFKRLNLSEEDEQKFTEMLAEKEMVKNMSPRGLSGEEKEDFNHQKNNLMNDINQDIADFLGDDQELYENFQGLEKEYNQLMNVEDDIESVGGIDEFTQDELAQFMNESYLPFNKYHQGWKKAIAESQESAESFLTGMKELNEEIINNAPIENDQKIILEKIYDNQYNHFSKLVDEMYSENAPAENGGGFEDIK